MRSMSLLRVVGLCFALYFVFISATDLRQNHLKNRAIDRSKTISQMIHKDRIYVAPKIRFHLKNCLYESVDAKPSEFIIQFISKMTFLASGWSINKKASNAQIAKLLNKFVIEYARQEDKLDTVQIQLIDRLTENFKNNPFALVNCIGDKMALE